MTEVPKETLMKIVTRLSNEYEDHYAVITVDVQELLSDIKWAQELDALNSRFSHLTVVESGLQSHEGLPDPESRPDLEEAGDMRLDYCYRVVTPSSVYWYLRPKHATSELESQISLTEDQVLALLESPQDILYDDFIEELLADEVAAVHQD